MIKILALNLMLATGLQLGMSSYSMAHAEDIVVIVNPATDIQSLDKDHVMRIFLIKAKTFPNETTAAPVYASDDSSTRKRFEHEVFEKSPTQIKAYWTRLMFTGRGRPPPALASDAEIIKTVASTPGGIGYVNASSLNDSVKEVYRVK